MADAVYIRFPAHVDAIEALLRESSTFREICADYEEASALLAGLCRSQGLASEKCDLARELVKDLEGELERALSRVES
jgi:hypothetical protein